MEEIKNINALDTYLIRQPILRAGKPIESCYFEGDSLETTIHFGMFINEKLIAVVSIFKNSNSAFSNSIQFQLRGMAVLSEFQKKGYGLKLVKHCEEYLINQKGSLIWFNARLNAATFYEKLDYKKFGNPFSIAEIGPHFLMKKEFDSLDNK